jgi:predicted CopG family antitoxin
MRLNVDIKKDVYDEFARHCTREGRSLSDVIRGLVINWNAKKRREEIQILRTREVKNGREEHAG